jgi:hypothetical protein
MTFNQRQQGCAWRRANIIQFIYQVNPLSSTKNNVFNKDVAEL